MGKRFLFAGLVTLLASYSVASFADDNSLCEMNPSAPMCLEVGKTPPSLPESYSLGYLIHHASSKIRLTANEQLGQPTCRYENSKHVAYRCQLVTSRGRACQIELLQIWERADYRVSCGGKLIRSVLVNPGPVPETMD